MKLRAVMDTNVLYAAFRSRLGASFELFQRLRHGEWIAVVSNHLIYEYEEVLKDRPWDDCKCDVCQKLGIQVIIFRGAERNRRRGFHNVFVTYNKLKRINQRKVDATA